MSPLIFIQPGTPALPPPLTRSRADLTHGLVS